MQFRFADFVLDTDRRELTRRSEPVPLGPQVFDLLAYLLQNRERVVSKDDLFDAIWQGRVVSESTLTSHINAVRKAIGDSGETQGLVRTIPRKGFRFVGEVARSAQAASTDRAQSPPASQPPALALPDRPSIAVLPFQNLSGDAEQDYFADGIVEDIITGLSRIKGLFVIARNSSFTYKGRAVDVKQVGRELGVRYVLEGSVRKAANRVRISGQLIDASSGTHIWADRFEGMLDDIFDLQDQVAASVVGPIAPQLENAEIERAKRKQTDSLDAYDYFLRGMASFYRLTRKANDEALRLFSRAIELDPDFAVAHAMAAWCFVWRKLNGWMIDREWEIAEGGRLARQSVELGRDDAIALSRSGHAIAHLLNEVDEGAVYTARAVILNPNLAVGWYLNGWVKAFLGELDAAIEHQARAMRLSPLDPTQYNMQIGTAFAHMLAGGYEEASLWIARPYRERPDFLPTAGVTAASHAFAGRMKEAEEAMARLRRIDPTLRISNLRDWYPLRPIHLAQFAEGLRKAGLPE